jgi:hypothetical protein
MSRLLKNQQDIREALETITGQTSGLTKKIAETAKQQKDAVKTLESITKEVQDLVKNFEIINTENPARLLKQFGEEYVKILKEHNLSVGGTKFRLEEIYLQLICLNNLGYDPWENKPAYLGGDLDLDNDLSLQIKSPKDFFRIHYNLEKAEREMKNAGFSEGIINDTLYKIAEARLKNFKYEDLKKNDNKIEFIKYYHEISRANWYVLFYNNAPDVSAVSFPAELLPRFAEYFYMFFKAARETNNLGKILGLGKLAFGLNRSDVRIKIWQNVISAGVIIHYVNVENFYKHRSEHFTRDEIQQYNKVFWDNRGFEVIQNTFFAPVQYKGR